MSNNFLIRFWSLSRCFFPVSVLIRLYPSRRISSLCKLHLYRWVGRRITKSWWQDSGGRRLLFKRKSYLRFFKITNTCLTHNFQDYAEKLSYLTTMLRSQRISKSQPRKVSIREDLAFDEFKQDNKAHTNSTTSTYRVRPSLTL